MPKLVVDGKEVEVQNGATVLQACEAAGVEIPRFCYHERLAIAGNCRMCLVEMEKAPKPIASCAMPAGEGMVIHTNTPNVKKAREGVMEFLLINHPLDCPICDQGGECDLQDQAMEYGRGTNRFHENKRAVKDKYMGPLVETQMTRCIHCTRCIRFITDVAGVPELGATGRGEHMEVGTYVEKALTSELSGNIIDLCPVGALTSAPYAFKARSWELKKTESIDVLDALGSNIRVDTRGLEVMRILPKNNDEINEEWLGDKSRFAYDGLKYQRLDKPMIRKDGKFVPASYAEVYDAIKSELKNTDKSEMAAIAGDLADVESMWMLKKLMNSLGSQNYEARQDKAYFDLSKRFSYLFNTTIENVDQADLILLIGSNPRHEATVLNARLRKASRSKNFIAAASIGRDVDHSYDVHHLGNDARILEEIASGKHPFVEKIKLAKKPILIIGTEAQGRKDARRIFFLASKIAKDYGFVTNEWNGFNVLHKAASRVGALEVGFTSSNHVVEKAEKGEYKFLFLLGADEIDTSRLADSFVVYVGHHGDKGAHAANVILPATAYTEKSATYVNIEGRAQRTKMATLPVGEAKEDWRIIREIAEFAGVVTMPSSLSEIRKELVKTSDIFVALDQTPEAKFELLEEISDKLLPDEFNSTILNYYMTDVISRSSRTMAKCSQEFNLVKEAV